MEKCKDCTTLLELKILYEIARIMSDFRPIDERIETSMILLQKKLHLERCTFYTLEESTQELVVMASIGLTKTQEIMATYKMGEGATGLAAQTREPVIVENVHSNILFLNKTGARTRKDVSYIAVPIVAQNIMLGVLSANLTVESKVDFDETIKILTIVSSLFSQFKYLDKVMRDQQHLMDDRDDYYKSELLNQQNFDNIIGRSSVMQRVFFTIRKVAASKATILIRGETGTGKELVASALHSASERGSGPFIKLNCAAIPESLLESELFGHEKGAFTDAREQRKGRFELASGGTLFLDEIGDISANLQSKLLRVLQEQEFERVGGSKTIQVDVRIVAATNRNLEEMVQKGEFREDLFYRLNVIPIHLPPLRDRGEDISLLATHFLSHFNKIHKKQAIMSEHDEDLLMSYTWPGNIRELENTMERLVLLSIDLDDNTDLLGSLLPGIPADKRPQPQRQDSVVSAPTKALTKQELMLMEKDAILQALEECHFVKVRAARKLGITNRQIGYKIEKYGIDLEELKHPPLS